MAGDMGQDEIDKLLADALGGGADSGESAPPEADSAPEDESSGAQSQDDIDALLAGMAGGSDDEPADEPAQEAPAEEPSEELSGPASQDDIDALLAQAAAGEDLGSTTPEPEAPAEPAPAEAEESESGAASQDEIDALLAGAAASEPETDQSGEASQDDIDQLFEEMSPEADRKSDPNAATHVAAAVDENDGPQDQSDIDALLAGLQESDEPEAEEEAPVPPEAEATPEPSEPEAPAEEASIEETPAPEEPAAAEVPVEEAPAPEAVATPEESAPEASPEPTPEPAPAAVPDAGESDLDEFLGQLGESEGPAAAGPELPDFSAGLEEPAGLSIPAALEVNAAAPAPEPTPQPTPAPQPVPQMAAPQVPPASPEAAAAIKESLSLLTSAGEVEGIAGQMASLLGQLSERARRYQDVWLQSDQEAKQLRSRLMAEEHRQKVLECERAQMQSELDQLRKSLSKLEGEKLGQHESARTEVSALQMQIREQESRMAMLQSEVNALKDELERARTEATGSDLESRRSRFETDRLRSEVDSERMERTRLQRALENREKEIQAMQAQSAGQASSLFLDELHRLVRRLESELDVRTSACHEAMRILDHLIVTDDMVPVQSNLRAALQSAAGLDADPSDALKSLSRETTTQPVPPKGDRVSPGQQNVDIVSFETAINALDLDQACEVMGTLLRTSQSTSKQLMEKVYRCPAMRRPEVAQHLDGAIRLLRGIREVQESGDHTRGREGPETNRVFVQMFDYLHNLVRLKLIARSTTEAWQFFLEIRERFSFVTSDKQWGDYRDSVLGGK